MPAKQTPMCNSTLGFAVTRVFRPDVYRAALLGTGEPLPAASSKVEGSIEKLVAVGTQQGNITLERNRFFDGTIFDPADIPGYLARLP